MTPDLARTPRHGSHEALADRRLARTAVDLLEASSGLVREIHRTDERTIADQIEVTSIPAPPFGEEVRAAWMAQRLAAYGALDVHIDAVGNVVGRLPGGDAGRAPIVVAAHLDTVFPAGVDVTPRWEGDRIVAPGISDDGRGLAALLTLVRVLAAEDRTVPVIVAATVGEEGIGDLRGVRALFGPGGAAERAGAFVSLDGAGVTRVISAGVGSRRRRVRVRGPGGHSWVDWGRPNPIEILGRALAAMPRADEVPPGTTWSAGRIAGGKSVNAIPEEAWIEVEVRGERAADLDALDAKLCASFEEAVRQANLVHYRVGPDGRDPTVRATLEVEAIGDRPAGATPASDLLVGASVAATRALDLPVELAASSTDANVPMSLGVPAITLGAGGEARGAHTLSEWYRNSFGPEGVVRAMLTLLVWDRVAGARAADATDLAAD
jgi:acetylornithine deacetylase/succinyl-diaminopimelate desuccinylase-like protein